MDFLDASDSRFLAMAEDGAVAFADITAGEEVNNSV